MSTVITIVADHLRSIGADGLVCPAAECGCKIDDLAPCEDHFGECQPGWVSHKPGNPHDWLMWSTKEMADSETATHQPTKEAEK